MASFLNYYDPPKPKPRVIYVSKENFQILKGDKVQYPYDEKRACEMGRDNYIKFVEALE